ncbi:lipopolysaccharide biosynthesis protein [Pseudactinotalea terrae]|uniref:lipopolysaccharide biosynthesis protein n=1 Tax=Pseudactinotalea terrae TaxID=1743262 RepID=UPI0012E20964|nr:lipopolysaccharide biosynthesis protein [Pseudactinotalea terrae]
MVEGDSENATTDVTRQLRTRSMRSALGSGVLARVIALLSPLLVLPIMLDRLGPDLFGLWATATSVLALATFADLGTANAVMSGLSVAAATNDWTRFRSISIHAYALAFGFSSVLAVGLVLFVLVVDPKVYIGPNPGVDDWIVRAVMFMFIGAFLCTIPLTLIQRVQYSLKRAWQANAWQAVGALAQLGLVWWISRTDSADLAVIGVAIAAPPAALIANTLMFYLFQRRDVAPIGRLRKAEFSAILRLSLSFFFLSILTSISMNIDQFLIAGIAGLESAGEFAIANRLFSVLGLIVTMAALAMWPSNADALASRDLAWIRRNARQMAAFLGIAVTLAATLLYLIRNPLTELWLGRTHQIGAVLGLSLVTWSILRAVASPYFSIQNAHNHLRPQYIGWSAYLACSIALKAILIQTLGIGGAALGACITYLLILIPTAWLGYRGTMGKVLHQGVRRTGDAYNARANRES